MSQDKSNDTCNIDIDDSYFSSYEDLDVHKIMISDTPRSSAYQKAIENNKHLFAGKTIMDVGAGTGILSLFCAKAGAKKVYAVEASNIAKIMEKIVEMNGYQDVITVIHSRVEDVKLPNEEKVDVIISEWMGFYLFHESMLTSVISAREQFLSDNGIMFPSSVELFICPCSADMIYNEEIKYWDSVYGFDFSPAKEYALLNKLNKPQITIIDEKELIAKATRVLNFNLQWIVEEELELIKQRVFVSIDRDSNYRGFALWFNCHFGIDDDVTPGVIRSMFSTSPFSEPTHWKQTVLLLPATLKVELDEIVGWELTLRQSDENPRHYNISVDILDPEDDEHPVPCSCGMAKCVIIATYLKKEEELEM